MNDPSFNSNSKQEKDLTNNFEQKLEEKKQFYVSLLNHISVLYKSYDDSAESTETHFEKYPQLKQLSAAEKKFIFETFDGLCINQVMLDVLVNGIFKAKPAVANRAYIVTYMIVFYLIIFRFSDIDNKELSFLLYSQDPFTMNTALSFIFSEDILTQFCLSTLETNYDTDYLKKTLIDEMADKSKALKKIIKKIKKKAVNENIPSESKESLEIKQKKAPKVTKFEPFNLSKGMPTKIPEPIVIPVVKPNNKKLIDCSKTLQQIEKSKEERRSKIKELTLLKNTEQIKEFELKADKRIVKKIEENKLKGKEEEKEPEKPKIDYKKALYEPGDFFEEQKWTRAMILKEQQKFDAEIDEQKNYLNKIEGNLRNSQEFKDWQVKMLKKDEEMKMEKVQNRKKEMKEASKKMRVAVEKKQKINEKIANQQKEKARLNEVKRKRKYEKEVEKKKGLKVIVEESRKNYQKAKKEQLKENRIKAIEQKEKNEKDIEKRKMEHQQKLEAKRDIVKKIREMEKRIWELDRFEHKKEINEYTGFLIDDLQFEELKKKLKELKIKEKDLIEKKRQTINKKNQKEKENLQKIKEKVLQRREKNNKLKKQSQIEKKTKYEKLKKEHEEKVSKGEEKLLKTILKKREKKMEEIEQMKKKEKEFNRMKQFANQEKDKYEQLNNKHMTIGKENYAKNKQKERLMDEYNKQTVKIMDIKSEDAYRKSLLKEKMEIIEHHDKVMSIYK